MFRILSSCFKAVLRLPLRATAAFCSPGEKLTRFFLYRHLMQVLKGRCIAEMPGKILSISGSSRVCELIGTPRDRIVEAPYPEYNVLDLRFENNQFDMVCFDQVLEHVEGNPQRAIDEIQRVLKPGGVMVCATVLVYPIHGYPSDYWRFTPEGLRLLCSGFSTILDYGGWGNMYVWMLAWLGLHQELVPECRWHPLYRVAVNNDPNWKIVTWIVAQK